jgi:hypothetical protein
MKFLASELKLSGGKFSRLIENLKVHLNKIELHSHAAEVELD